MQLKNIKTLNNLLAQHGQATNTSAKKEVWRLKGLDKRFGDYAGTPAQIKVLTKSLINNPVTTQQKYIMEHYGAKVYEQTFGKLPETTKPVQPAPQVSTAPTLESIGTGLAKAKQSALGIQAKLKGLIEKGYGETEVSAMPQDIPIADIPSLTPTTAPTTPSTPSIGDIGGVLPKPLTATEVYEQATGSQAYKLEKEGIGLDVSEAKQKAEVGKAELQTQFEADKTELEQAMASKGLAFSGIRIEQTQKLIDNLATSELGVDRELANALMRTNLELKEAIFDAITDVVKDATAGREEAIDQLNKAGLAVVNETLVPTLAAQKEQRMWETAEESAARSERTADRLERQYQLQVYKFQSEENRRETMIEGDVTDYLNGIIGLDEISGSTRPEVKNRARNFIHNNEAKSVSMIDRKFEIANDLGEAITLTDDEIRIQVYDDYVMGNDYETVKTGINNLVVENKKRMLMITEEIYFPEKTTESSEKGAVISPSEKTYVEGEVYQNIEKMFGDYKGVDISNLRLPSIFRF